MFRVNAQMTTLAAIQAGGGEPGGTNAVIFIDTADNNILKALGPDGSVYVATSDADNRKLEFVAV